jgi:hypothetical protein
VGDRAPPHQAIPPHKHPVLVSGSGEDHNYLPGLPRVQAYCNLSGFRESPDDTMADYARGLIEQ